MPTHTERSSGKNRCLISVPTSGDEPYPVLCFLHGAQEHAGNAGDGNPFELLKRNYSPPGIAAGVVRPPPKGGGTPRNWDAARDKVRQFLIVSPQLLREAVWGVDPDHAGFVGGAVNEALDEHNGDRRRIYLTGFSNGGIGALTIPDDLRCGYACNRWAARWAVDPAISFELGRTPYPAEDCALLLHHGTGISDIPGWKKNSGSW